MHFPASRVIVAPTSTQQKQHGLFMVPLETKGQGPAFSPLWQKLGLPPLSREPYKRMNMTPSRLKKFYRLLWHRPGGESVPTGLVWPSPEAEEKLREVRVVGVQGDILEDTKVAEVCWEMGPRLFKGNL